MQKANTSHHFYELDVLRFLAAFSVLLFHLAFRRWNLDKVGFTPYPEISHITKYGYLGVDMFFLISGFVILLSASKRDATSFLISRASRLYPAYWICATLTFSFIIATTSPGNEPKATFIDYIINLSMLQSFSDT